MTRPALRVGVRLAAVNALLVLAVGTALLAASFWLLAVRLPNTVTYTTDSGPVEVTLATTSPQPTTTVVIGRATPVRCPMLVDGRIVACPAVDGFDVTTGPTAAPTAAPAATGSPTGTPARPPAEAPTGATGVPVSDAPGLPADLVISDAVIDYQSQLLRRFATQSAVLLLALAVPAVLIGGYAARRAMRPVHAMSASAQRLGAESLGERLPVSGPRDELRELAETFNAMLDRIEGAFDRERRLMANVSHELRTPLANQHTALEVGLEEPDASAAELRRVAEVALEQNRRARLLIEELLELARVEQGVDGGTADVADLADAARRSVEEVRSLPGVAPDPGVILDLAPAVVQAQAVLVERLVGNLVENAVRYNEPGGFVRVTTRVADGAARVEVENSGPVVPPDAVAGLFEPFRRGVGGAGDRVRSDQGLGLGLSLVTAVARRYGARVDATARPGGGLHVTVTFPARVHTAVQPDPHGREQDAMIEVHPNDA